MTEVTEGQEMKRIPIAAAQRVAEQYGYDQVVIIARKIGDSGGEHVTTYGIDKANCAAAAKIGDFLKFKILGWPYTEPSRAPMDTADQQAMAREIRGRIGR